MDKMDEIQLNLSSQVQNSEALKEIILGTLVKEKYLTDEDANKFADEFIIILIKKSWYKRLFKDKSDAWEYRCVKIK